MSKAQEPTNAYGHASTVKGGEKTKSEWEDLEALSKDELIIELMKERFAHREIGKVFPETIEDYPAPKEPPYAANEDDHLTPGYMTSEEWARKIILYAKKHAGREFGCADATDYGLDLDQAETIFDELAEEHELDWPSSDPRSRRFSGIAGYYTDEVAALDPAERERLLREDKEGSDGQE